MGWGGYFPIFCCFTWNIPGMGSSKKRKMNPPSVMFPSEKTVWGRRHNPFPCIHHTHLIYIKKTDGSLALRRPSTEKAGSRNWLFLVGKVSSYGKTFSFVEGSLSLLEEGLVKGCRREAILQIWCNWQKKLSDKCELTIEKARMALKVPPSCFIGQSEITWSHLK